MELPLKIKLTIFFKAKQYFSAKELLVSRSSFNDVVENGMELISIICEQWLNETEEPSEISLCSDMLNYIAKYMSPKLGIISFLEQAQVFNMSPKFVIFVQPLQIILSRTSPKKPSNIGWILKVLNCHLKTFQTFPEIVKRHYNKENDNGLFLEKYPESQQILLYYNVLCQFYETLLEDITKANGSKPSSSASTPAFENLAVLQNIIRDNLVDLLGPPLVYMNLCWKSEVNSCFSRPGEISKGLDPKNKSASLLIAEEILNMISKVNGDSNYFLKWIEDKKVKKLQEDVKMSSITDSDAQNEKTDDDEDISDNEEYFVDPQVYSVANYMFLLYGEKISSVQLPQTIFSIQHVFCTNLFLVNELINNLEDNPSLHLKGFGLAKGIIENVNSFAPFTAEMLDEPSSREFTERLLYLVLFSEARQVRALGIDLFTKYLWAFEPRGKYKFLGHLFHTITHSGLYGHCIGQLKQFVAIALDEKIESEILPENTMKHYFLGSQLLHMFQPLCALENGVETDLVKNNDRIVALLNLLRFVFIRDVSNQTGLKQLLQHIEVNLLKSLRTALDLSKAHYELRLREEQESSASSRKTGTSHDEFELFIGDRNESVPELSQEDNINALRDGLNTLDLMNCLLAHVNESYTSFSVKTLPLN